MAMVWRLYVGGMLYGDGQVMVCGLYVVWRLYVGGLLYGGCCDGLLYGDYLVIVWRWSGDGLRIVW